ncbi:DUF6644 family protein [Mastigocladopsis repens]|uniref:DUF6644 family protein n=1 Tax=Mastigocladopsis repens TaxID=221287 RepID=UPI0002F7B66F|nr:DUF6644 family protein [Mastigocladopsis repens]
MDIADASWWLWLENSALSSVIRQWLWLYPMLETLHILSLAIVFGSVALFDFRLLGFSRHMLVTDMARYLLPWSYLSFAVVVLSGFLMFAVDATEIAANPGFRLKLLLLCAAGLNAAFFHKVAFKSVKFWNRGVRTPVVVRAIAVISLVLWTSVIICGRLIAYI